MDEGQPMSGWQWCSGAYGQCELCHRFVTGLWRYFSKPSVSTAHVCEHCAEGLR
jgi:hypothetical protein